MGSWTIEARRLLYLVSIAALFPVHGTHYGLLQAQQPSALRLSCIAQPSTVLPGEAVGVVSTISGLDKERKQPVYTWSSTGGRITGDGTGARIETRRLSVGDYVVTGRVSVGRGATRNAECTLAFRVIANVPPTIACSAAPQTIVPGGFTAITATAQSSRGLSYSYGASAGQITGNGTTATLAAVDVNPGTITVKCNVVDDRGQAASSTVDVEVKAPPPPPIAPTPSARKLCSVSFERDRKRPVRVDNEGKACLDDIALQLTRDLNATLVLVGRHHVAEQPQAAAERTLNVKRYMTAEKGIDPSRIQVRTGENSGRRVDDVLIPQGASWDPSESTSFELSEIDKRNLNVRLRHATLTSKSPIQLAPRRH